MYTIDVVGLIPDPSRYHLGTEWLSTSTRVIGGKFPYDISTSFSIDGSPTIYLGDLNDVWPQTQIAITSVLIDAAAPHLYCKDWVPYLTDESFGNTQTQYVISGTAQ